MDSFVCSENRHLACYPSAIGQEVHDEPFFFLTSKQLLNNCIKCLERLEVLLGTFRTRRQAQLWLCCKAVQTLGARMIQKRLLRVQ
jgi:hypothetical protein